jgi:hypothetical protein
VRAVHYRLALAVAAAVTVPAAAPAGAQSRMSVTVELPAVEARTIEGPSVVVRNVFADTRSGDLLASGFPGRVSVTVELWRRRWLFDELLSSVSWQRVVKYDPLSKTYLVGRIVADSSVAEQGGYQSLGEVRRAMSAPVHAPLPAPRGRSGLYYTASVTIETFNSNDLAELQRWLSGDVQPAIQGKKSPISALSRGILTLGSRMLGGDVKRAEGRSVVFGTQE